MMLSHPRRGTISLQDTIEAFASLYVWDLNVNVNLAPRGFFEEKERYRNAGLRWSSSHTIQAWSWDLPCYSLARVEQGRPVLPWIFNAGTKRNSENFQSLSGIRSSSSAGNTQLKYVGITKVGVCPTQSTLPQDQLAAILNHILISVTNFARQQWSKPPWFGVPLQSALKSSKGQRQPFSINHSKIS